MTLTRTEVRLRLVEAAMQAGRRNTTEIVDLARSLEPYVLNVPVSTITRATIVENVAQINAAMKKQGQESPPLKAEPPADEPEDDDENELPAPLDAAERRDHFDGALHKIKTFLDAEEDQKPVVPAKRPCRVDDKTIRALSQRKIPVTAIAEFLGYTPQHMTRLIRAVGQTPHYGPRGPTGGKLCKEWVARLRAEQASKGSGL